jgi:hypothetical protein
MPWLGLQDRGVYPVHPAEAPGPSVQICHKETPAQRWAKFRPSELPIPIPIFRLHRLIFSMDINTFRVVSSLQN